MMRPAAAAGLTTRLIALLPAPAPRTALPATTLPGTQPRVPAPDRMTPGTTPRDHAAPRAMARSAVTLQQAIPGAELRTLAGQDHNPSAQVLAPILAELAARPGA